MDLSISFDNLTTTDFNLSVNGYTASVVVTTSRLPGQVLSSHGSDVMAMANQTPVGEGAVDFWCCWIDESSSSRFGVKIIDGGQPFGVGPRPYWQVMWDNRSISQAPVWQPSGDDPASPFKWPASTGFNITAGPVSTHETLNIVVLIKPQT